MNRKPHATGPDQGGDTWAGDAQHAAQRAAFDARSQAAAGDRRARLLAAAEALHTPLDEAAANRLMAYLGLLQRWNKVYNLTALRDPEEMLSHHLVDCLAVLAPLRRHIASLVQGDHSEPAQRPDAPHILDVGSGGGLPGVVLAVLEPGWQVDCVDTVAKKASFIRQVAAEVGLPNLRGLHARVEALSPAARRYQVVTSRAFASLPDFTSLTRHLLAEQGVWMAMKGRAPGDEQAALPASVQVFHVEQLAVPGLDAQRCLVWMRPA
ncbi:16S rRNA (guanine(527)-N(7))-methyltransferase RsmG [Aquabacterium sp. OR-4]|uniref:16S rRNA (guanine(527)-N(7))-methyltransferase RsmG n=1 Tax=Aquabacterium sp. OR-4 TaxID=2978127 RepID=UPI0021B28026|nr:16S rRNA (guanine(527)-N(7))-methyltransferase RsmG [Aquabacterium sp. OR-4]MDT7833795.1 16S rRNA (guanine(527)-N(7))-methyltransferase RsmG [Aquabacterium sp. OR-4]